MYTMKTIGNIFLALLAFFLVTSCEEDELDHTQVSPVTALYSPDDNAFFNLKETGSVNFEWEPATAEDNGVVFYEVLFDEVGGDFSDPLYSLPSDGKGMQRSLELPAATLNRIAEISGLNRGETGKVIWTAVSSKGINRQEPMDSRTIELERAPGFPPPAQAYLAGTATEAGDDVTQALAMTPTGDGNYEIYTSLKPGDYYITTAQSTDGDVYSIQDGKLELDGQTTFTGDEGVYRIRVGFNDASTNMDEIKKLSLYFSPTDEFLFDLPYNGNGTWKITDAPIEFKQESWGRDERYKFRFVVDDGSGNETDEWYGSTNADNSHPDANTPESFWYMVPVSNDRWNNSFKFVTEADENNVDIEVIFNNSVPEYTHIVTPK